MDKQTEFWRNFGKRGWKAEISQKILERRFSELVLNCGSMEIFDDLVEFVEMAADMCADTVDYIVILASGE